MRAHGIYDVTHLSTANADVVLHRGKAGFVDVRCGNEGLITSNVATSIGRAVLSCETRERGRSRVSDSDDAMMDLYQTTQRLA